MCFSRAAVIGVYLWYEGDPHRFGTNVTTGPLAKGGFTVTLDSKPLTPGKYTNFLVGKPHKLEIKAAKPKYLRGFLFRLAGGVDAAYTFEALAPYKGDTTAQFSIVCVEGLVGGVTHTSNSKKTSASANLTLDVVASYLPLDVTVVVQNRDGNSIFYYSWYWLNSVR
jgi:hypothetical protein